MFMRFWNSRSWKWLLLPTWELLQDWTRQALHFILVSKLTWSKTLNHTHTWLSWLFFMLLFPANHYSCSQGKSKSFWTTLELTISYWLLPCNWEKANLDAVIVLSGDSLPYFFPNTSQVLSYSFTACASLSTLNLRSVPSGYPALCSSQCCNLQPEHSCKVVNSFLHLHRQRATAS